MFILNLWERWHNRRPAARHAAEEAHARRVLGVPAAYPENVVTDYRERHFEQLQGELWPNDTDSFFIHLF